MLGFAPIGAAPIGASGRIRLPTTLYFNATISWSPNFTITFTKSKVSFFTAQPIGATVVVFPPESK